MGERRVERRLSLIMGLHPLARVLGAVMTVATVAFAWLWLQRGGPRGQLGREVQVWAAIALVLAVTTSMLRGYRGVVIDADQRTVWRWWGLMVLAVIRVPLYSRRRALAEFDSVVRRLKTHTSTNENGVSSTYYTYPVVFAGPDVAPFQAWEGHSLLRARRMAEAVARFADLQLVDEVDRGPTRSPDELDVNAIERLLGRHGRLSEPSPPPARVSLEASPGGVVYRIAPSQADDRAWRSWVAFEPIVAVLAAAAVGSLPLLGNGATLAAWTPLGGLILIPLFGHYAALLRWGREPAWIALQGHTLAFTRSVAGLKRTVRIPLSQIEELFATASTLMVVGDRRREWFATGLDEREAAWLVDEILRRWQTQRFGERPIFR